MKLIGGKSLENLYIFGSLVVDTVSLSPLDYVTLTNRTRSPFSVLSRCSDSWKMSRIEKMYHLAVSVEKMERRVPSKCVIQRCELWLIDLECVIKKTRDNESYDGSICLFAIIKSIISSQCKSIISPSPLLHSFPPFSSLSVGLSLFAMASEPTLEVNPKEAVRVLPDPFEPSDYCSIL